MSRVRTLAALSALALAGCQSGNPLDTSSGEGKAAALAEECRTALSQLYAEAPQAQEIGVDAEAVRTSSRQGSGSAARPATAACSRTA